jgi:acetyl-CoA carboxylase biotin carboxylase subunit
MQKNKLKRVLIANRGEIALRIQRACQKLGIATVTIASEVDSQALFARKAEKLVIIGPAPAKESYLAIEKIVAAAKEHDCDAVHPGYGFLSENAEFAKAVTKAGLCFVGPTAESIESLGSKTEARRLVRARGVPTTEGCAGGLKDEEIVKEALRIGFPVIIKAVAGGGGRGMRIAQNEKEIREALPLARAEALKNFSNEAVYIEQYIHEPRHVEVQVFGDTHGKVLHFGTRDCSTQRRHQKLVEEAPAPFLPPALRSAIEQSAVEAAKSVGYVNAGTAEFLVKDDRFYFLEMNTRIQVEHPVTEVVTGVDLVELQLRIAQGEPLPMTQEQVSCTGHAIEFRIYAEDPSLNFAPSKGKIEKLNRPQFDFVREDHGIEEGDTVSLYYDAMLSKLIVHGANRAEAISRSLKALKLFKIEGLATTLPFHRWLLLNSPFAAGPLDIGYLGRHFNEQCLKDLEASEVLDPRHVAPVAGAMKREELVYFSEAFNTEYHIQVLHQEGGVFLAQPVSKDNRKAPLRYCRRSNGFDAAVVALTKEVLEVFSPKDIFS